MKKRIGVILLCFAFLGCGCNNGFDSDKLTISPDTIQSDQKMDMIESSKKNDISIQSASSESYLINSEIFKDTDESNQIDISIQYPKISGLADAVLQNKVNSIIKEAALEPYYDIINTNNDLEGTEWPVNYSIVYETNNILSIKFEGYIYTQGCAHGTNYIYSVNVNLLSGKKIAMDELFDASFQEKLNHQYFKGVDVDTTNADDTAMSEIFDRFKTSFVDSDNNFYFTDDKLVIILPISDYYQFSSSYENLKSSMKQESSVWRDILDNN